MKRINLSLKHRKRLKLDRIIIYHLFFIIHFFLQNSSFSQIYCDSINYLTVQSFSSNITGNCTNYINYTVYPDYGMTPIKYIRISFWIIQKSDGSGSFIGTDSYIVNYFKNLVSSANEQLGNLCTSMPLSISTNYITDSRIRIVLNKVHFLKNDALYNYTLHKVKSSTGTEYYPDDVIGDSIFKNVILVRNDLRTIDKDSTLNIIMEPSGIDGKLGGQARLIDKKWYIITRAYDKAYNYDGLSQAIKKQKGHLIHEIFHTLGLNHSYTIPFCFPVQSKYSTNNFMDYPDDGEDWSTLCSFSECQIALVHYLLISPSTYINKCYIRDYCLKKDTSQLVIYPTQSIVWNSSKNLVNDVIINGMLTIECKTSLPTDAKIIIKDNGKLVVSKGILKNDCNVSWQGIEVQNGGYLELANTSISDYSITVLNGGTLKIKDNVTIAGNNRIDIMSGAYVCIENNATINLQDILSALNLHNGYIFGLNPAIGISTNCINSIASINKTGNGAINLYTNNVFIQNQTFNNNSYISGNNISAGNNVTTTRPQGPVVIQSGANVVFDADGTLLLDKGFEVQLGAGFEGK